MKMTQDQLNEIVRLHGLWLRNDAGGKRADLTDDEREMQEAGVLDR